MQEVMYISKCDNWGTPQHLFEALDKEFHFTLDACADQNNYKCENYFDKARDGLKETWEGQIVFCNPPYSRKTKDNPGQCAWIEKCYTESRDNGATVVLLIPARTDTEAFHNFILGKADEIRFVKGRLAFEMNGEEGKERAPFPSMIVIYKCIQHEKNFLTKVVPYKKK